MEGVSIDIRDAYEPQTHFMLQQLDRKKRTKRNDYEFTFSSSLLGEVETKQGGVVATVIPITKPIEKSQALQDRLFGYK